MCGPGPGGRRREGGEEDAPGCSRGEGGGARATASPARCPLPASPGFRPPGAAPKAGGWRARLQSGGDGAWCGLNFLRNGEEGVWEGRPPEEWGGSLEKGGTLLEIRTGDV